MVAPCLARERTLKGLFRTFLSSNPRPFWHFLGSGRYRRIVETATRQFMALKACGPDDPDGMRTATVLSAYLHAEEMRAFRRLLWRRLIAGAAAWLMLALTTTLLSRGAIVIGFAVLGGLACWAAAIEWNAVRRLRGVIKRALQDSNLRPPGS